MSEYLHFSESAYGDNVVSVNDDPPVTFEDIYSIVQYGSEYIVAIGMVLLRNIQSPMATDGSAP